MPHTPQGRLLSSGGVWCCTASDPQETDLPKESRIYYSWVPEWKQAAHLAGQADSCGDAQTGPASVEREREGPMDWRSCGVQGFRQGGFHAHGRLVSLQAVSSLRDLPSRNLGVLVSGVS